MFHSNVRPTSHPLVVLNFLLVAVFLLCTSCVFAGCASSDDIKGAADAANRAAGGEASGSAGSKAIDLNAGVTQTGDVEIDAAKVSAQRNISNTAAGSTYSAVTIASGGGAEALQRAIAADAIVKSLSAEIQDLTAVNREERPTQRIDDLRAALAARVEKLETELSKSTQPTEIHDVVQIVVAPSALGRDPGGTTQEDVSLARYVADAMRAAKGLSPAPPQSPPPSQETPSAPTSKPSAVVNDSPSESGAQK